MVHLTPKSTTLQAVSSSSIQPGTTLTSAPQVHVPPDPLPGTSTTREPPVAMAALGHPARTKRPPEKNRPVSRLRPPRGPAIVPEGHEGLLEPRDLSGKPGFDRSGRLTFDQSVRPTFLPLHFDADDAMSFHTASSGSRDDFHDAPGAPGPMSRREEKDFFQRLFPHLPQEVAENVFAETDAVVSRLGSGQKAGYLEFLKRLNSSAPTRPMARVTYLSEAGVQAAARATNADRALELWDFVKELRTEHPSQLEKPLTALIRHGIANARPSPEAIFASRQFSDAFAPFVRHANGVDLSLSSGLSISVLLGAAMVARWADGETARSWDGAPMVSVLSKFLGVYTLGYMGNSVVGVSDKLPDLLKSFVDSTKAWVLPQQTELLHREQLQEGGKFRNLIDAEKVRMLNAVLPELAGLQSEFLAGPVTALCDLCLPADVKRDLLTNQVWPLLQTLSPERRAEPLAALLKNPSLDPQVLDGALALLAETPESARGNLAYAEAVGSAILHVSKDTGGDVAARLGTLIGEPDGPLWQIPGQHLASALVPLHMTLIDAPLTDRQPVEHALATLRTRMPPGAAAQLLPADAEDAHDDNLDAFLTNAGAGTVDLASFRQFVHIAELNCMRAEPPDVGARSRLLWQAAQKLGMVPPEDFMEAAQSLQTAMKRIPSDLQHRLNQALAGSISNLPADQVVPLFDLIVQQVGSPEIFNPRGLINTLELQLRSRYGDNNGGIRRMPENTREIDHFARTLDRLVESFPYEVDNLLLKKKPLHPAWQQALRDAAPVEE